MYSSFRASPTEPASHRPSRQLDVPLPAAPPDGHAHQTESVCSARGGGGRGGGACFILTSIPAAESSSRTTCTATSEGGKNLVTASRGALRAKSGRIFCQSAHFLPPRGIPPSSLEVLTQTLISTIHSSGWCHLEVPNCWRFRTFVTSIYAAKITTAHT